MQDNELQALEGLLELAGKMSNAARRVVGGRDITLGNNIPSANLDNLNFFCQQLREAVDNYDEAILRAIDAN